MKEQRRYVLLEVFKDSNGVDDWSEALTEEAMLEMLADRLGYDTIKKLKNPCVMGHECPTKGDCVHPRATTHGKTL